MIKKAIKKKVQKNQTVRIKLIQKKAETIQIKR